MDDTFDTSAGPICDELLQSIGGNASAKAECLAVYKTHLGLSSIESCIQHRQTTGRYENVPARTRELLIMRDCVARGAFFFSTYVALRHGLAEEASASAPSQERSTLSHIEPEDVPFFYDMDDFISRKVFC